MKKKIILTNEVKDRVIIWIRLLLSMIFFSYGISKLTGNQFGNLTLTELNTPIKDLSLFKIAWYLFDHQPFKFFTGICEVFAATLLLFRRTTLLGTLVLFPIIINILIIDIMIMPQTLKVSFIFRLTFYLLFCSVLLFFHKEQLIKIKDIIFVKQEYIKFKYWKFLFIPLIMILLEMTGNVFKFLYYLIISPESTFQNLKNIF